MLISRLALLLFCFPGVCPLRLEYFHIPQKDYGFLFLFSLFNFQGPVRFVFLPKCLTILPHLLGFVKNFFSEAFSQELFYSITPFPVCQELFRSLWFGTFLSYHNRSGFVKIFFRSVERLTILPRFLSLVNAFFRFFSPFSSVCHFCLFYSQFLHNCLLLMDKPLLCPYAVNYLPRILFFAILRTSYLYLLL